VVSAIALSRQLLWTGRICFSRLGCLEDSNPGGLREFSTQKRVSVAQTARRSLGTTVNKKYQAAAGPAALVYDRYKRHNRSADLRRHAPRALLAPLNRLVRQVKSSAAVTIGHASSIAINVLFRMRRNTTTFGSHHQASPAVEKIGKLRR
jgi:hypothetical protein